MSPDDKPKIIYKEDCFRKIAPESSEVGWRRGTRWWWTGWRWWCTSGIGDTALRPGPSGPAGASHGKLGSLAFSARYCSTSCSVLPGSSHRCPWSSAPRLGWPPNCHPLPRSSPGESHTLPHRWLPRTAHCLWVKRRECCKIMFLKLRDGSGYQNGGIFGKRGGGHFQCISLYWRFWTFKHGFFGKNCNIISGNWGEGVKGRLENSSV